MPSIQEVRTRLFRVPLAQALYDAKHGEHTHFELITVQVRGDDGLEGVGYTYTGGRGGHAVRAVVEHDLAPWLHALVSALTRRHEAGRPTPWSVDDAPADYVAQMLRAIVGVEIRVTRLVGKWKMSQNRSAADCEGVAAALAAGDDEQRSVAAMVAAARATPTAR